jgi:hypothetical protein
MARRKKRETTRRRRRRMSGIGGDMMNLALGATTGAVVAKVITKMLPTTTISPTYVALGTIGIGLFVPKFIKGSFGQAAAAGMIGTGVINTLSATGIMSGIMNRKMPMRVPAGRRVSGGLSNIKTINGAGSPYIRTINGAQNRTGNTPYPGINDLY